MAIVINEYLVQVGAKKLAGAGISRHRLVGAETGSPEQVLQRLP